MKQTEKKVQEFFSRSAEVTAIRWDAQLFLKFNQIFQMATFISTLYWQKVSESSHLQKNH